MQISDDSFAQFKIDEKYWLNHLTAELEHSRIPYDFYDEGKLVIQTNYFFELDAELSQQLVRVARESDLHLLMILVAGISSLLQKYTMGGQTAVITTAFKENDRFEDNQYLMKNLVDDSHTFEDVLMNVQEVLSNINEHSDYPIWQLLKKYNLNNSDFFAVPVVILDVIQHQLLPSNQQHACVFYFAKASNLITCNVAFNGALYKANTISRFADQLDRVLRQLISSPKSKIADLNLITGDEIHQQLMDLNRTEVAYPSDKTIVDLFAQQVNCSPERIAVQDVDHRITYQELDRKSNQLASLLLEKGIHKEQVIGLLVNRSVDTVIGMLGILKAGGAYLPIDIDYPDDRINYLVRDSGARIVITQINVNWQAPTDVFTLLIENHEKVENISQLVIPVQPSDLCYVIYTSGTTGNPKGVMVEHRNVVRLFFNDQFQFRFSADDIWTMYHSPCFDFSVWEIYGALLFGGKVIIIPKVVARDPRAYLEILKQEKVTVLNQTPSAFYNLAYEEVATDDAILSLRYVIFGGEAIAPYKLKTWRNKYNAVRLINMFGITETTVHVTFKEIGIYEIEHNISNIGKPIPTLSVYIFDAHQNLVPKGMIGELYVGGAGVSRGYLGNQPLTDQKFVMNPYKKGDRLYRSGDLARILDSGDIEYIGRLDEQTQLRGFRIELGEIERKLALYEGVKESIVVGTETAGLQYLVGYYLSKEPIKAAKLRTFLANLLPDYMVPSYFVHLTHLPLTANGKLDKKSLPKPSLETEENFQSPANHLEVKMAVIWAEVLGLDEGVISMNKSFFELGGHSLTVMKLSHLIHQKLGTIVPINYIFKYPTIRELTAYMNTMHQQVFEEIPCIGKQEYYPLSSAQKRMYILNQFDKNSLAYNIPFVLELQGEAELMQLNHAFRSLIDRHESLRTSFDMLDRIPVQRIHDAVAFSVDYRERDGKEIGAIIKEFVKPFDLSKAPLIRVGLISLSSNRHLLITDIHHIVSDGISLEILSLEFLQLYHNQPTIPLKIQYKDYAVWQQEKFSGLAFERTEAYWLEKLAGVLPRLHLPLDFPRPTVQSFEGDSLNCLISSPLQENLRQLCRNNQVTMHILLMAAYNVLLHKYSGQEDIIVGNPVMGRTHPDLERMVGMFVNAIALRNAPTPSKTFREFLGEVKQNALEAYQNQDYPFEELVSKVENRNDSSRHPIFDTMLILENQTISDDVLKEGYDTLLASPYGFKTNITKFDILVIAVENETGLTINIQYASKLFRRATIERFMKHFIRVLEEISKKPDSKLSEVNLWEAHEQYQLLTTVDQGIPEYVDKTSIHYQFAQQVRRSPDQPAVVWEGEVLTYQQVDKSANDLASLLRNRGLKTDDIVGVMLERSPALIVAILGVLKAGGVYLPIDPTYPIDRKKYVIQDSQLTFLLSVNQLIFDNIDVLQGLPFDRIIDLDDPELCNQSTQAIAFAESELAYIIYTSGSTGNPKGVAIGQQSLLNYLSWAQQHYVKETDCRCPLFTSIAFDLTITSIFLPLVCGGTIYIYPENEIDVLLKRILQEDQVSILKLTPSHLKLVRDISFSSRNLKCLVVGGEIFTINLAKDIAQLFDKTVDIYNEYGPTEATVGCMLYQFDSQDSRAESVLIGKAAPNCQILLLDAERNPVPVGVVGEIYIGGVQLAQGYLGKDKLTSERFITDQFRPGERLYRTGDLARQYPDGNMVYLGRMDDQIKLRGYRIELAEIENQVNRIEKIKDSAVIVWEDSLSEKHLCCYYLADHELDIHEIRQQMLDYLPDYMVPNFYQRLNKLPITLNGKVDKSRLPSPAPVASMEHEPPQTPIQQKLVDIWSNLLGIDIKNIGINNSFFQLGGHSLRAMSLTFQIHKELQVAVPVNKIFEYPTIRELADYVQSSTISLFQEIPLAKESLYYPLSSAQQRMYFLHQFEPLSLAYNMPLMLLMEGLIDYDRLENAFRTFVARHEALRTSFILVDQQPVQQVHQRVEFQINRQQASEQQLDKVTQVFVQPFDLAAPSLLRVEVVELAVNRALLMVDMHHIISDGVSMELLNTEFAALYQGQTLPALRLHYKDYALWQLGQQHKLAAQQAFWLEEFAGPAPILDLPLDYTRTLMDTHPSGWVELRLDSQQVAALYTLAQSQGASLFMVLLAVYNVLLSKLTGQCDVVVGTVVAGRQHADLETVMGMFVNTLAIRNYPEEGITFNDFLSKVKAKTLASIANQDYPYESLIGELPLVRQTGRNPLFDVMFTYNNAPQAPPQLPSLVLKPHHSQPRQAKFDLTLVALEDNGQVTLQFEYATDLFKQATIERFAGYLKTILQAVVQDADVPIGAIDMLSSQEKYLLVAGFNQTSIAYPKDKTVIELFEEQVSNAPQKVAVLEGDVQLTYQQLNQRANQLAHLLRQHNVQVNECVGVLAGRSIQAVIAMVAILKAGAAYLPLDPDFPRDRIEHITTDSQTRLVLVKEEYSYLLASEVIVIHLESDAKGEPTTNLAGVNTHGDLSNVMYTSGTTGNPKGVMVTHRNVVRLVKNTDYVDCNVATRVLQTGAPAFDAITFEIWGSLLNGGTLCIVEKEVLLNTRLLSEALSQYQINTLFLTTSLFDLHAEKDPSLFRPLKYLMVGGDILNPIYANLVREKNPSLIFIHIYGPTENTTFSLYHRVNQFYSRTIPIGKPVANSTVYILSPKGHLQPIGVAGELCVGGDGVAAGYLHNERLTQEKFLDNPHKRGERIYRTGDLGRWLAEGVIEFIGRLDQQVKIRGFRVELGEIEQCLIAYEPVREAVVLARETDQGKHLVAYYLAERSLETSQLRSHLIKTLPEYMVPSYFVRLETIPLTLNGKVNKAALPEPSLEDNQQHTHPVDALEEKLTAVWAEVLRMDQGLISTKADFFELGGHSLKAAMLVNRMAKEFDVEIPLKVIFSHQTISRLAAYIKQAEKVDFVSIPKAPVKPYYPLSSAQQRMYFLHQFEPLSLAYNMPQVVRLQGQLDKEKLQRTYKKLIARHDSLRTTFVTTDQITEPVQQIADRVDFDLEYFQATETEVESILDSFIRPFNLSMAPLFRAGLISVSETEHLMIIDMYHIITDGVSQGILISDFMALYNDEKLPELNRQYKDYAEWQQGAVYRTAVDNQKSFWINEFAEASTPLLLPVDFQRPQVKDEEGSSVRFHIESDETSELKRLAERESTTLYTILLSIFNVFLGILSNSEDITIGTPVSGRQHVDLEGMIGLFVNTLPIRCRPEGVLSFRNFLSTVVIKTQACFENQEYPYESLVDNLQVTRDMSHNPLFDVLFSYHNFDDSELKIPRLTLSPYSKVLPISKFDLTLDIIEHQGHLNLNFEYATRLFKAETINRFIAYFKKIVAVITADPNVRLKEIEILSTEEKGLVINRFNDTAVDFPVGKTIVDLFEEKAELVPNNTAVLLNDQYASYAQLNADANQVANFLLSKLGLGPNDLVVICMEKSIHMISSVLGVWKAGGAYVPADVDIPDARFKYIVQHVNPKLIITDSVSGERITKIIEQIGLAIPLLVFEDVGLVDGVSRGLISRHTNHILEAFSPEKPPVNVLPENLAYCIFTSGSTGEPKAVLVQHQQYANATYAWRQQYCLMEMAANLLQMANFAFDVFAGDIAKALANGGTLVLCPYDKRLDFPELARLINDHKISLLEATPALVVPFLEYIYEKQVPIDPLKLLIIGSDVFSYEDYKKIKTRFGSLIRVINSYGVTEATIDTSFYEACADDRNELGMVPIGRPMLNMRMYVLNRWQRPLPIGVPGELYIAGEGVSMGYFNQPVLNSEKFMLDPFIPGKRMYKTGDAAKWLPDGNLLLIGRLDQQVKIRGFRIEMGEIESHLNRFADIKKSVVVAQDQDADKFLIAYYEAKYEIPSVILSNHLASELPAYMIPTFYVRLDTIPLTPSGKLDKKALTNANLKFEAIIIPPATEIEAQLVVIWGEVLKVEKTNLSVDRSFFEVGGHSLKATVLINRIKSEFNVEIPLREIFTHVTVRQQASFIESNDWLFKRKDNSSSWDSYQIII